MVASGGGAIDGDAAGASITSPQFGAVFEHVGSNNWKITAVTSSGGSNGTNGNTIWNGTSAPGAGVGVNGDFYIQNPATAPVFWGPKASGAWPGSGISLVGPGGAISTIQVNDTAQTVRSALDLKAGSGVTLTPTDNAGAGRTEVLIAASGGSGNGLWRHTILPYEIPSTQTNWSTLQSNTNYLLDSQLVSTGAQNAAIGWKVTLDPGTWSLKFYYSGYNGAGIFTITLGGSAVGTVDSYASSAFNTQFQTFAGIVVSSGAAQELLFTMATKNASSSGYGGALQFVSLARTA